MKTMTKPVEKTIAAKYGLLDPAAMPVSPNILTDGDMELAGVASWSAQDGVTLTKETTLPHSGLQCLRCQDSTANGFGSAAQSWIVGATYNVTGWARSDGVSVPRVYEAGVLLWNGTTSTDWQFVSFTRTPIAAAIKLVSFGVSRYAEFDDFEVLATQTRSQFEMRLLDGDLYNLDDGVANTPVGVKISQEKCFLGNALNFGEDLAGGALSNIPLSMPSVRSSTVSCEFWYKPAYLTATRRYILAGSGNLLAFGTNNWVVECFGTLIRVFGSAGTLTVPSSEALSVGNWYHIAFTASAGTGTIYINGKVAVTGALVLGNTNTTGEYLGATQAAAGIVGPGGLIVAPRFYSTLRTAVQVQASYDAGAQLVQLRTTEGIKTNTSAAGQTGGFIGGNSPFLRDAGTWSINPDLDVTENISKVLTCNSAGSVRLEAADFRSTPGGAAYGTWDFWFKKQDASVSALWLGDEQTPFTTFNGYRLQVDATEAVYLSRVTAGVVTNIAVSAPGLVAPTVWTHVTITRRFDGQWNVYINNTLMTAVVGTMPVTDATHKTAQFAVLELDAGDQVAVAGERSPLKGTDYSFTKRLGVVAP